MPTIFSNTQSSTGIILDIVSTPTQNTELSGTQIQIQNTKNITPYYAKINQIRFSNFNTPPTLYAELKNGLVTYATTTFTVNSNSQNNGNPQSLTIPLQTPLANESTSGITFNVVNRPSEIPLISVATQTDTTTWQLNHSLVIINNQSITIPSGHTLTIVNNNHMIYNDGTIYLYGNITSRGQAGRFINGYSGLIFGTISNISGFSSGYTANLNSSVHSIYGSGPLIPTTLIPFPIPTSSNTDFTVTGNSILLRIGGNGRDSLNGERLVIPANITLAHNFSNQVHLYNGSNNLTAFTHIINYGVYNPLALYLGNAIIINYGTINLSTVYTIIGISGAIINYGTIQVPGASQTVTDISNFAMIINAPSGKILNCRIENLHNNSLTLGEVINYASTSMSGVTTTGTISGVTLLGKSVVNITCTIPPMDMNLDTSLYLYSVNSTNGKISIRSRTTTGMLIELGGSIANVNPPIPFPSKIGVITPITYKSNKVVNFTGPPTTQGIQNFTYSMYSTAGTFTVASSGTTRTFTMPNLLTPISYNKVAIYANANTTSTTGFNPFSIFAETSIRDYTADLPANKQVLYACAYNKEQTILILNNGGVTTQRAEIYMNVTQNVTLDSLDFGYMLPVFRSNGRHMAGFKNQNNPTNLTHTFYIDILDPTTNNALRTSTSRLVLETLTGFDAMYDSNSVMTSNDGSPLTIPFAMDNSSLPTRIFRVSPMERSSLNLTAGTQIIIRLSTSVPYSIITSPLTGFITIPAAANPPLCCSVIGTINGTEVQPTAIGSRFGTADSLSNSNIRFSDQMTVSVRTLLTGFFMNGFKVNQQPPVNIVISIFKNTPAPTSTTAPFFEISFDYQETGSYNEAASSTPLYIPFSHVEYNRIRSDSTLSNSINRISALSLRFNGYQNPLFVQSDKFIMRITSTSNVAYKYTVNASNNGVMSGSLYGIVASGAMFELINNVTIKYNGVFPSNPTAPSIITGNPRGTSETFAIMTNDSMLLLKTYAIAIGKLPANRTTDETAAVTAFTSGTALVPFNNIVTTFVTNMDNLFSSNTFNEAIGSWDTSSVTSMLQMFTNATAFNQPIGSWNTVKVTSMQNMFVNTALFNQPIGSWDTINVVNMRQMFNDAVKFNQPIESWDTTKVTDMTSMFQNAGSFNQPIGSWNTTKVTDMTSMFQNAGSFNQPIGSWNTANVTNIANMFINAKSFNQPIGSWNTSKVTDMGGVFGSAHAFNSPINSWNTANVVNMASMFVNATVFNQNIGSWNTANVVNMSLMFSAAIAFNQPINYNLDTNAWNTSKVTDMANMFHVANTFNSGIGSWDVAKVTSMSSMFRSSKFNQNISAWNVSNVTNMSNMFDSSGFNAGLTGNFTSTTSRVTYMAGMFRNCQFNHYIGGFNTTSVVDMSSMFQDNISFNNGFIGGALITNHTLDWNIDNVRYMSNMFYGAKGFNVRLDNWYLNADCSYYGFNRYGSMERYYSVNVYDYSSGVGVLTGTVTKSTRPKIRDRYTYSLYTYMPDTEFN